MPDNHGGVHHAFAVAHDEYAAALGHLRAHGLEIAFEEDRQGGVLNGPRAYFHDPDGTVLEFIDLTSYAGSPSSELPGIISCGPFASHRPKEFLLMVSGLE